MQDYVLSNSSKVRQASYQPRTISKDILGLSYGLGDQDELIRKALRNSSARRDENAPLYLAPGDVEGFEERNSMRALRQQHDEAKSLYGSRHGQVRRLANDISDLKATLSSQLIDDRRTIYFETARLLRASGLPTDNLVKASVGPTKSHSSFSFPAAACISRFLIQIELGGERRTQIFPTALQGFLSSGFAGVQRLVEGLGGIMPGTCDSSRQDVESAREDVRPWRCLLCPETTRYNRRSILARHHQRIHLKKADQFDCPECIREGKTFIVSGPGSAWFNHAERTHGKHTAPYLLGGGQVEKMSRLANSIPEQVRCFFCDDRLTAGRQFSRHFNKQHGPITYGTFYCPECRRDGREEKITGQAAWLEHTWAVHKCDERGVPLNTQARTKPRTKVKWQRRAREQTAGGDNTAIVPSNKPCGGCTDKRASKPRCCLRRPGTNSCEECIRRGIECVSRAGYGQSCSKCIDTRLTCWVQPGKNSCVRCSKSQIKCERRQYTRQARDSKRPATHPAVPLSATDSGCGISETDSAIDLDMAADFDMVAADFDMMADPDMAMGLSFDAWEVNPEFDASAIDTEFDEFAIDPELLAIS